MNEKLIEKFYTKKHRLLERCKCTWLDNTSNKIKVKQGVRNDMDSFGS